MTCGPLLCLKNAKDAAESESGVFVVADGDGIYAHLDDGIIVATGLSHVAEVEDVGFFDFKLFEEMSHAKFFVHARSDGIDRSSAADFVVKFGGKFFAAGDNLFAFFAVWVPSVFCLGASLLPEGREGDLREAILNDFVAFL